VTYDGVATLRLVTVSGHLRHVLAVSAARTPASSRRTPDRILPHPTTRSSGQSSSATINGNGAATAVFKVLSAEDTRITGGDLFQTTGGRSRRPG